MNTDKNTPHNHAVSGKTTTSTGVHSHSLTATDAALAALDARLKALETPIVVPPPVEPPPTPPPTTITVAAGGKGVTITRSGQVVENLTIVGPGCATNGSTFGIYGQGAFDGVVIRNCVVRGFDRDGIHLDGLTNVTVENCTVEDISYTGIMLISVVGGMIRGNTVRRIGVITSPVDGTTHNAYGIAATDTGGPRSADLLIEGNTIMDVPRWHGLDTHGGLRLVFRGNTVRRTPRAVFITSSNTYKATDCLVDANLFTEPIPFTSASFGTNPEAMTAAYTVNCRFTNNHIGAAYGSVMVNDYASASTGLVQSNNTTGETLP